MTNLEKLTEATMLALQGKLFEKENKANRVINAKIRQADRYIDELIKDGLYFSVWVDSSKANTGDNEDLIELAKKYDSMALPIDNQQEYNDLVQKLGSDCVYLFVTGEPDPNEFDTPEPAYSVKDKTLYSPSDYEKNIPVNKDVDIYNFLKVREDRIYDTDDYNFSNNDYKYGKNAKYSDDTLAKNGPELRASVKSDLDTFNQNKAKRTRLQKDLDKLNKDNDDFSNDDEIIAKSQELDTVNNNIQKMSRADGSFDTAKARKSFKSSFDNAGDTNYRTV